MVRQSDMIRALVQIFAPIILATPPCNLPAQAAPLTLDEVFATVSIDMAAPSPDGRTIAVVVLRPPGAGEASGRTSYEVDPSRADVWLVERDGSGARRLTDGAATGAGFWCAQWSPDGQRLALLSTQPEGSEPHGGDAVRLYIWNQAGGSLVRLSDQAMMTQTRYGSPLNALDLQDGKDGPKICRRRDENAPFLWLDNHRLLAVQMPAGQNSALFAQYGQPATHSVGATAKLRAGREPTLEVSDSPEPEGAAATYSAEVALFDVETGERRLLADVPAYPFEGTLSLLASPDRRRIAVLAPRAVIPPVARGPAPLLGSETGVLKDLGLLSTDGRKRPRWIVLPSTAHYPLELAGWSANSRALALRARSKPEEDVARLFTLNAGTGSLRAAASGLVNDASDAGAFPHEPSVSWQNDAALLMKGRREADQSDAKPPETWWRVQPGRAPRRVTNAEGGKSNPSLPPGAEVLARDGHGVIWQDATREGLFLRETLGGGGASGRDEVRDLFALNGHLKGVSWGEIRTIDYQAQSGRPLKGLVILPPGYRAGQSYPVIVWVYPGTVIEGTQEYWSDSYLPGIYNLQLYAARGYVVLVPSMPISRLANAAGPYEQMTEGVLPAVDRLVAIGIADPARVGVMGQSFGGYAVYALITQTDRFGAAAAVAGLADLAASYGTFDAGAKGWPGIAQDKSANPMILPGALAMQGPPFSDPALYFRNSPVNHLAKVRTPLLLAHGSLDVRGGIGEAEAVFTQLYRQGRTARLLRYDGEGHAISLSTANVRSLFNEITDWFDRYLGRPR